MKIWVQPLTVKLTSSVLPVPWMVTSTGTGQQTEMPPEMTLTLNQLRRPTTERPWGVWEVLWTGTGFLSSKLCPPLLMTIPLPVHVHSQPVKSVLNYRWTTGFAERCPASTSPSERASPPETLTTLASSGINSSKPLDLPDGKVCMLRRTIRVQQYAPGHRTRPNSTIPSAGLQEETCLLPHPPRPSVKICSGIGREQHGNRQ